MLKRFVFPCGVLAMVACGGGKGATDARSSKPLEPATSDSAGIRILVHAGDAFERAPQVVFDSVPVAVIHGSAEDAEADLSTITPNLFLADGRFVGIDDQRQVLVVFSADGSSRREYGRKGAGPGEFAFIGDVVRGAGDTLLLNDYGNGRASEVALSGGAIRDIPLSAAMGAGGRSLAGRVGARLLMWSPNFPPPSDDGTLAQSGIKAVVFSPASGDARRVFTTGPAEQEAKPIIVAGNKLMAVRAFSITALTAFPEVHEWQGDFLVLDPNQWHLERRDTAGAVRELLRIKRPRRAVTSAIWSAHVDEAVRAAAIGGGAATLVAGGGMMVRRGDGGGGPPDTAATRRNISGQRHADSLPAFARAQVTANGTLWLLDYPVPGESGWAATAIDRNGRILGRLVQAKGEPPVVFGDDRLAFRSEDADGIATITIRRIRFGS